MPIFYLDSGSIDRLEISSSLLVSGSFTLSGSMNSQGGLTGSLLGTASLATTASYYELVTGSAGTNFNIVATPSGSIINIPDASATARGLVTTGTQTFAGGKSFTGQTTLGGASPANATFFANNSTTLVAIGGYASGSLLGTSNLSLRLGMTSTLNGSIAANDAYATFLMPTLTSTEASSGTHILVAHLALKPLFLNEGVATTTNSATLYIENATTGSATITNNYSIWVDDGITRLDGDLIMSGSNIRATGSISATAGFTGSLLGTASFATTASYVTGSVFTSTNPVLSASYALSSSFAVSASWAPGGTSTPTFPYTGSAIISGSLEVTGSFRTLASGTEGGAITGDVNNYLEFYVQNKNTGVSASTDLVAYNDTGNKTQNYVDMGINSTGISPTYSFGKANDAYIYNTGGDLFIGNSTAFYQPAVTSQSLHFFTNAAGVPDITITGSRVGIEKSSSLNATLDVNGNVAITGSLYVSGSHEIDLDVRGNSIFTGSVRVTGSLSTTGSGYFTNKLFVNSTDADLDPTNPESLFVSGSNINVIHGEANINTYAQLNIVNFNNGAASSADIVATNNTGNESGNYVDLGINGSNFGGAVGGVNEAYLFNTGSNFLIGNITRGANANLKFFAGNDATVFPLVVTGSTTIVTGSLLGTASQALTASSVGRLNQDVIITGSLTVSGSAANEVIVLGQTVITGSLIVSGSLGSGVFSKGGTVADFVNLIAISASYYVWRAPYSASVVALYGRRETGSATTAINARRSGSAGYALHTGSNLILTADATWLQANTVANTAYAPGDSLEIIISGSANEQVAVQVDFIKL